MSCIRGKAMTFGLKNLMTLTVYGLLLLLFFLIIHHWHSYTAPDVAIVSHNQSGESDTVQASPLKTTAEKQMEEAGAFLRSVLHGSVKRQLSSGHLYVDRSDKRVWKMWANDSRDSPCFNYNTRFGVGVPQVWLLSFPCSGNTWLRYLLEAASGIFTGSIYYDELLVKKGFLAEGDNGGKTLVQKTHQSPILSIQYSNPVGNSETNMTRPTVLLIRNPANAIISFFKFQQTKSHVDQIPEKMFNTTKFHTFVKTSLVDWMNLAVKTLMRIEAPLHVIHYEHLVQNPMQELTKVLAFLGVARDEGRMACIASHLEGSFKRKGSKNLDPYTTMEKISIVEATKAVNRTLQLTGYSPLPPYN
ncbi:sialate:O-sulfotransferase 1-like isoform X1 [Scylla paramamosain]|uniref:sialate:O-sulfotransferase 1-like isoform X1 n=3 Tax=Scylla paramamosain TaxID=85552 RepID=UPI003083BE56